MSKLSTLPDTTMFKVGNDDEWIAYPFDELKDQISDYECYRNTIPKVYIAKQIHLSYDSQVIIDNIEEDMLCNDMHEYWSLEVSDNMKAELQAAIDKIMIYNMDVGNTSYTQGEEVEIDLPEYLPEVQDE